MYLNIERAVTNEADEGSGGVPVMPEPEDVHFKRNIFIVTLISLGGAAVLLSFIVLVWACCFCWIHFHSTSRSAYDTDNNSNMYVNFTTIILVIGNLSE